MVIHENKQHCIPPVGDVRIKVLFIKIIYLPSFKHVTLISEGCPWKLRQTIKHLHLYSILLNWGQIILYNFQNVNITLGNSNFLLGNTNLNLGNSNFILGNTNLNLGNSNINLGNTNFNLYNTKLIPIRLIFAGNELLFLA
jgi:hypothetical protein